MKFFGELMESYSFLWSCMYELFSLTKLSSICTEQNIEDQFVVYFYFHKGLQDEFIHRSHGQEYFLCKIGKSFFESKTIAINR